MPERKLPVAEVTRVSVELSPPVDVFNVVLTVQLDGSENEGSWEETYSTEAELRAFLRGCTAMASMATGRHFADPPIPHEAKLQAKPVEID